MKVIPLAEAQMRLGEYGQLCHEEAILVSVDGIPRFQLTPIDCEDDDLIDRLITGCPEFVQLLESRKNSRLMTAKEALDQL